MKQGYVYWIRCVEHTDPYNQGYVGVSTDPNRRFREHKSRSRNPILKNVFNKHEVILDILFVGEYTYCYYVEHQYRPEDLIGWNINKGGFAPPDITGIKRSEKTRMLMSQNNVGFSGRKHSVETKSKMSAAHAGQKPHNMQAVVTPGGVFESKTAAAKYHNVDISTITNRTKSDSQNYYLINSSKSTKKST